MYIVIFVYVLIMPFLTAPTWCAQYYDKIDRWQWTLDCSYAGSVHIDSTGYNKPIRLVGGTQLSVAVSNTIDICLVSFLTFVRFFKASYSDQSASMKSRNYMLLTLLIIALVDGALGIFVGGIFGYISNYIRPVVAVVFMGQVRQQFYNVLFTMKELAIFVSSLFIYILIFALLCAFYFRESF